MKEKDKLYEFIIKDLTSEISKEEKIAFNKELEANFVTKRKFYTIKEFWTKFFPPAIPNQIIEKTEKKLGFTYGSSGKSKARNFLKIAATILLIVSVSFSAYQIFKPKIQITLNEYVSAPGETKEITLSDGTKVWLNSMSLLIASEPFIGDTREVKLFGEAYFEVKSNPDQPFIVQTPRLKTKVLGTRFNIDAQNPHINQIISLYEGKVQLITTTEIEKKKFLTPGDKAYFSFENNTIKIVNTDLGEPAKWRDGILRLYDENLFTIAKKLEHIFQTQIFIADSAVGNLRFSAEFDLEPLEKIMELLNDAHKFDYKITDNGIIIQSAK